MNNITVTGLNVQNYSICLMCDKYNPCTKCNDEIPDDCNIMVCKEFTPMECRGIGIVNIDIDSSQQIVNDKIIIVEPEVDIENNTIYSLCLLCENYRKGYSCCSDPNMMENVATCIQFIKIGSRNVETNVLVNMLQMLSIDE